MTNKYLKPMLDVGSPRVFNCNEMTRRILAKDLGAKPFFRNKPLNIIVLIKDLVPESERRPGMPMVGTKLYFPFNENNIYEGGRTIFLHDRLVKPAIMGHFGEGALSKDALETDIRIMTILNSLPSLDPFLMKDVFLRNELPMNEAYFEVSEETWNEIETFMLQQFESLVTAAFPETKSSEEKARLLIDKMWEARDIDALQPLIQSFRLPQHEALDIFSSWRGIVYYSFQYRRDQPGVIDLVKWLNENQTPVEGVPAAESKEVFGAINFVKDRVRKEWQLIEDIVRDYQTGYDKMFKYKQSSTEFLSFLKNCNTTYWNLGNSLGKINHAVYCWGVMSSRFPERKMPWAQFQEMAKLLAKIFEVEKKTGGMAW